LFETDYPRWLAEESPRIAPEERSEEHGSYIIEALETGRVYCAHFNVTAPLLGPSVLYYI